MITATMVADLGYEIVELSQEEYGSCHSCILCKTKAYSGHGCILGVAPCNNSTIIADPKNLGVDPILAMAEMASTHG